jgi:hypothetical protein
MSRESFTQIFRATNLYFYVQNEENLDVHVKYIFMTVDN